MGNTVLTTASARKIITNHTTTYMELKSLIQILEKLPPDLVIKNGFDCPHSWRGIYAELAFTPTENTVVADMLTDARSAVGATYEGYKGGDFTMDENTRVHFSYYGSDDDESGQIFCSIIEALLATPKAE